MPAPSLRRVAGRTRSPNADKIGPWFRELRQALGPDVKASDIGRRMGVETPATPDAGRVLWTKLETGKNQASTADVQEAIARALSVDPSDVRALVRGDLAPVDLAKRAKLAPLPEAIPDGPRDKARAAAELLEYPPAAVAAGLKLARANETARVIFDKIYREAKRVKTKGDHAFDQSEMPETHDLTALTPSTKEESGD